MADIKLTKNGLRDQQTLLVQLEKYLPTLRLKKAMLQAEIQSVRQEILKLEGTLSSKRKSIDIFSPLLAIQMAIDPLKAVKIKKISKRFENIAGVELPYFEGIEFEPFSYNLFETAPWIDSAITDLRAFVEQSERIKVSYEQRHALEKELREVSIRVNLFEKVLIPRALSCIRRIKVFLGDQELAAVSRAKVAKNKLEYSRAIEFAVPKKVVESS